MTLYQEELCSFTSLMTLFALIGPDYLKAELSIWVVRTNIGSAVEGEHPAALEKRLAKCQDDVYTNQVGFMIEALRSCLNSSEPSDCLGPYNVDIRVVDITEIVEQWGQLSVYKGPVDGVHCFVVVEHRGRHWSYSHISCLLPHCRSCIHIACQLGAPDEGHRYLQRCDVDDCFSLETLITRYCYLLVDRTAYGLVGLAEEISAYCCAKEFFKVQYLVLVSYIF